MGYRKLHSERLKVVLFVSGYHVQDQILCALRRMGHQVHPLPVGLLPGAYRTAQEVQRALLAALVRFRPDFVMTINHIGFDQDGEIGHLLEQLRVPVAAWYVDCPFLVHDGVFLPGQEVTELFVWERQFLPALRAAGASSAHWLPLACDPESLAGGGGGGDGLDQRVVFVGNSMQTPQEVWSRRLPAGSDAQAQEALQKLQSGGRAAFPAMLMPLRPRPDPRMTVLAWATYRATAESRAGALRRLGADAPLTVVGDPGWRQWLPGHQHLPAVAYGPALAAVYRKAAVTINLTSLQMPTAVNQRAFDVPAAGGALVADEQEDLCQLLPADARCTFACADELVDKVLFLLRRPAVRRSLAARAHQAVLAGHTYVHRMKRVIDTLRRTWAPASPSP